MDMDPVLKRVRDALAHSIDTLDKARAQFVELHDLAVRAGDKCQAGEAAALIERNEHQRNLLMSAKTLDELQAALKEARRLQDESVLLLEDAASAELQ
jgi:hypothetical protein